MKFETFKAGVWRQRYQYKSFEPVPVNHEWIWEDATTNTLLEAANRALGELNAFSLIVPDIDLFIEMHVVKEAQTSSRIEGTQTGLDEALMSEEQIQPEKRDDWREVRNYIDAVNMSIVELKKLPLSNRLLKQTHEILMRGVRGEHKQPGEFRASQNWIGGSSLTDAVFIPPHQDGVPDLMSDLEAFWHNEEIVVPHLIRVAISHYQFETIHPFLDGNGRIGRLLIPLYLISKGLLRKPSLYLSDYLERHRGAYYDALTTVRASHDLLHWIRFFLTAVIETCEKGKTTFTEILRVKNEVDAKIVTLGRRAEKARNLILLLYRRPVININQVVKHLGITPRAANLLVNDLVSLDLLKEITGYKRNRLFSFRQYVRLFAE